MSAPLDMSKYDPNRLELVYGALGGPTEQFRGSERDSLIEELTQVLDAKSARAASKVIAWWECWDRKRSATAWAREFRRIYTTGKLW